MNDPRCKCTMSMSVTGDGCRYCQPQLHIERLGEWLDEERNEIIALHTKSRELQVKVSALVEALEQAGRALHELDDGHVALVGIDNALAAYRKQGGV